MKTILLLLVLGLLPGVLSAQGRIEFQNSPSTKLTNTYQGSGELIRGSDGIRAALYYAPDGVIDFGRFVPLGASVNVGVPVAGIFVGGTRTTPASTAPGGYAMFQVRIWEAAYGPTFEAAISAPPMNGRVALVGVSTLMRIPTPGSDIMPPAFLASYFTPFSLGGWFAYSVLSVRDVVVAEGPTGTTTASFTVSLSRTSADPVTVAFATVDESALAGSDYAPTNGVLTFAPGEQNKVVNVTVTGDLPIELDEVFHLDLSSASNATILRSRGTCTITQAHISGVRVDTSVSFNTLLGQVYGLERSVDMNEWEPVVGAQHVLGTGGVVTVVDAGSGCDVMRHYRLLVVP